MLQCCNIGDPIIWLNQIKTSIFKKRSIIFKEQKLISSLIKIKFLPHQKIYRRFISLSFQITLLGFKKYKFWKRSFKRGYCKFNFAYTISDHFRFANILLYLFIYSGRIIYIYMKKKEEHIGSEATWQNHGFVKLRGSKIPKTKQTNRVSSLWPLLWFWEIVPLSALSTLTNPLSALSH